MRSLCSLLSRCLLVASVLSLLLTNARGEPAAPSLRSVLLEQLRGTHDQEEWFVPVKVAIQGLTQEQAAWKDANENHSIAELVNHLIFWNQQQLAKLRDPKTAPFTGDNKETFSDKTSWETSVKQIDEVLKAWEKAIAEADEAKLAKWSSTIAKISTHNAYHTGQIIYIRKMRQNWDPEKGVK
jgi:DinB superfamily